MENDREEIRKRLLATLPKDPKRVMEMFVDALVERNELFQENIVLRQENIALKHQIGKFQRNYFGPKSERLAPGQQVFPGFVDVIEEAQEEVKVDKEAVRAPREKGMGHGRRMIPPHLPRVDLINDIPESERICAGCHGPLQKIGEVVSEDYDYVPATVQVIRRRRIKYACKPCGENVVVAPMPLRPIERGLPESGMLAHVIVSKYGDHLPLNRLSEIFARQGVDISRSTMCGWIRESSELLKPICDWMKKDILESKKINTDDTPVPVLQADEKHAKKGRLWVYIGDRNHPHTVFSYSPTREKKYPEKFLKDFEGYLQADAYTGYNAMFKVGKIVEVACWMHARRYFFEAMETSEEQALVALNFIRELYDVEGKIKSQTEERIATEKPPLSTDEIKEIRQKEAKPVLEQFNNWIDAQARIELPESPLGKAIGYAQSQWIALNRYTEDGDLDIDNGESERALRPVAVGRKNYMFFGGDEGGERAAVLYSLIASCKQNGVEPFEYLRDVIQRILTHPVEKIHELAPANWKKKFKSPNTS